MTDKQQPTNQQPVARDKQAESKAWAKFDRAFDKDISHTVRGQA